jgi:hypothetical protein
MSKSSSRKPTADETAISNDERFPDDKLPVESLPNGEAATRSETKKPLIPRINLDELGLDEDYEKGLSEADKLSIVIRKACGQGYFRSHPELHKNLWMLDVKTGADQGFYIVAEDALRILRRDENEDIKLFPARLTLCYARDSGLFLWPLRLPQEGEKNRLDEWGLAALRYVKLAEEKWVKMYTRKGGNCYFHKVGEGITLTPPWPQITLQEAVDIAFEHRFLVAADDPVLRRLLGKE